MITVLRRFFVDSWFGRVLILLSFVAFIGLGGTFVGLGGGSGDAEVVVVGHGGITPLELGRAIEQQVVGLMNRNVPASELAQPAAQNEIAHTVLRNLVIGKEVSLAAGRDGLSVNDALIRQTVFSMPEFKNDKGEFNRQKMNSLLQRNGLDENYLINQTRQMLVSQGLLLGFGDSAQVPDSLTGAVARFLTRHYAVDVVKLPFTEGALPAAPTDAQLQRFYNNHPDQFRVPEVRHARIVAMTPESVAASLQVPDKIVADVYKERSRDYHQPELRTVQVMGAATEEQARAIAQAWHSNPDWKALQKQFPKAIPVSLDEAREDDIPDPLLAKAIFAAPLGKVSGPIKTESGWSVVCVTGFKAPHVTTEADAKPMIEDEIRKVQAPMLLKTRLKNFEEAVAGSTTLEKIPADIGAVPAAGSLDAHGMTEDGTPAPLPGDTAMHAAITRQIFAQPKGGLPHVVALPDGSAFAVVVDGVTPSHPRTFDVCKDEVKAAWVKAEQKRAQDALVTSLLQKAQGSSLVAAVAGTSLAAQVQKDQVVTHLKPLAHVPPLVAQSIFRMTPGKTEMLEADGAFWLVEVTATAPASAADEQGVQRQLAMRQQEGIQTDVLETLGQAYTRELPPGKFNIILFNQVMQNAFQQVGVPVQTTPLPITQGGGTAQ